MTLEPGVEPSGRFSTHAPSSASDRALLDWMFETAGEDFDVTIVNAPSDIWVADEFSAHDALEWLWKAYERYPELRRCFMRSLLESNAGQAARKRPVANAAP